MENFITSIELEDTGLNFYKGYVISMVKEDVIFGDNQVRQILNVCNEVYDDEPYVYIANRKKAYNVNPTIYRKLENIENLAGIGIVNRDFLGLRTAQFEKSFSEIPFEIFTNLEDAINWSKELIKKNKAGL